MVGKQLGLDKQVVDQQKTAVQYGSGTTKCFKRLAGRLGYKVERVRELGFNSVNELLMNLIAVKAGFPESEVKNYDVVREINTKINP
jgi:hypothetical protein